MHCQILEGSFFSFGCVWNCVWIGYLYTSKLSKNTSSQTDALDLIWCITEAARIEGLFARQGTSVTTICSTGQRVQDTFTSKNTPPCPVQRTLGFFSEPAFWQLGKQIQHRSRKNKSSFQTTPVFRFHLCCKTPVNHRESAPAVYPHLGPREMV